MQPVCWWVGLCFCPVGCLVWGVPALEPTGCWVGPGLGEIKAVSRRAHANQYSPEPPPPVFVPTVNYSHPYLCRRPLQLPAGRSGPGSYEITAVFTGSWCTWDLVCTSKSRFSVFPSPVEFPQSNPTGLQSQFLWGILFALPDPQAGEAVSGSELSLLWENFCGIIIFQFVGHLPSVCGIWFHCDCAPPTISFWLLLCLWM